MLYYVLVQFIVFVFSLTMYHRSGKVTKCPSLTSHLLLFYELCVLRRCRNSEWSCRQTLFCRNIHNVLTSTTIRTYNYERRLVSCFLNSEYCDGILVLFCTRFYVYVLINCLMLCRSCFFVLQTMTTIHSTNC